MTVSTLSTTPTGNSTITVSATGGGLTRTTSFVLTVNTPPDTTPPVLLSGVPSGVLPSGVTNTTLSLSTNENATCKYGNIQNAYFGSAANTFTTTGARSHLSAIAGLTDGASYIYYVRCKDSANNENANDYVISFSVASTPPASDDGGGGIPPAPPTNPMPSDQANSVSINTDLNWQSSSDAVSFDIYFGETSPPTLIRNNLTELSFNPSSLSPQTKYYWRVAVWGENDITVGPIWSFTTEAKSVSNIVPGNPTNPSPIDGAQDVSLTPTLSWKAGENTLKHDLYFGTTNPPVLWANQFQSASFQLYALKEGMTYYWRIAEWSADSIAVGPLWSFTTKGSTKDTPPPSPRSAVSPPESIVIARYLTTGSRGDDVLKLQTHLQLLGHFPKNETPTGYYGAITKNAVEKYQCAVLAVCSGSPTINGYGTVGPRTRATLAGTLPPRAPAQGTGIIITRYLTLGFFGDDVRQLQVHLQKLGHFPKNISPTGYYGIVTEDAVKKFQCLVLNICSGTSKVNGYGAVGPRTREVLAQ